MLQHRPFLALNRLEPNKYGWSASQSFDYAMLTIRTMKKGVQEGVLSMRQVVSAPKQTDTWYYVDRTTTES